MNVHFARSILCLLTIIFLLVLARGSALSRESGPLLLPLAVAEKKALHNNPSLQEIKARIASSKARSIRAGELPDPQLTVGFANLPVDTFRLDQEPMTQSVIGLSQSLPFPGKLDLKSEMESIQGEVWHREYRNMQVELVRQVRNTWLHRFFLKRSLEVIDNNLELFKELVTVARKQYVVGRGLQQDVLLAQTELDRIIDEKMRIQDETHQVNSRLAELMARPYREFLMPAGLPELEDPPEPGQLEALLAKHPAVRARDAMIDKMRTSVELAEKEFYPDFAVNVSYGHRRAEEANGDRLPDFTSAMVRLDLPLFPKDRQKQELASARLEEEAAARKKQTLLLSLKHQVRSKWSALTRTRERIELFAEVILPESRQTVQANMAAYVSGELDFLELVRARLRLLQHELTLCRLRVEAQKAKADLLYLADQGDR